MRANSFPKEKSREVPLSASRKLRAFDFSYQNADGDDLSDLDLRHVNFKGASLIGVNFSGSDLSGVDLSYADLTDADFSDTILHSANLMFANIDNALFQSTDLRNANLLFISNICERVQKFDACDLESANISDLDFKNVMRSFSVARSQSEISPDIDLSKLGPCTLGDIDYFMNSMNPYPLRKPFVVQGQLFQSVVFNHFDARAIYFQDCIFEDCDFSNSRILYLFGCTIRNSRFVSCEFTLKRAYSSNDTKHLKTIDNTFEHVQITHSDLSWGHFFGSMKYVTFKNCNARSATFHDGDIHNLLSCKMDNVNIQSAFFCSIELLDALFGENTNDYRTHILDNYTNLQGIPVLWIAEKDLSNWNFEGAKYLARAIFTRVNFTSANFQRANLRASYFIACNLTDTNFEYANLEAAFFKDKNKFQRTKFKGATYTLSTKGLEKFKTVMYPMFDNHPSTIL